MGRMKVWRSAWGGAGTAAKRYVDIDPTFGAPAWARMGAENGTAFGPPLWFWLSAGPESGPDSGRWFRFYDPGNRAAQPEARGGKTAA